MSYQNDEELRLALVMNGGVSLAVWMGGATHEIFRLVMERHPVYQQLLDMTRTRARVDVMSGTSAGGINAAALALAMLFDGEFESLRSVWLETGDLDSLLRNPMAHNPGSLMQGDEFFLPQIERAFSRLVNSDRPKDSAEMPIDLRLTTTLLRGVTQNNIDDLGTPIRDVDHRASFRFSHLSSADNAFAKRPGVVSQLARAARSTASFPLAFEPSLAEASLKLPLEDATGNNISSEDRYLLDGGILDNKPFRNALHSIFNMKARHGVRRVLMYINPDAGGDDGLPSKSPDGSDKPEAPSLAQVLGASIVGIPQAQAITDQLAALREHNESVRARRESLLSLMLSFSSEQTEALAKTLFPIYRKRRVGDAFDALFTDLANARAKSDSPDTLSDLGKRQRDWLRARFTEMMEPVGGVDVSQVGWIPVAWPSAASAPEYTVENWTWGLFPVEFATRLVLDVMRRTQRLIDLPPMGSETVEPRNEVTPVESAPAQETTESSRGSTGFAKRLFKNMLPLVRQWIDDTSKRARRDELASGRTTSSDTRDWRDSDRPRDRSGSDFGAKKGGSLAENWDDLYRQIDDIAQLRREEGVKWTKAAHDLLPKLNSSDAKKLIANMASVYDMVKASERRETCGAWMQALASLLGRVWPIAQRVALAAGQQANPAVASDARNLLGICKFFSLDSTATQVAPMQELIYRILQLEVIEYSFADHEEFGTDAIIELAQISGNSTSPLGGKRLATEKLCGLQLAHFAAFYKRSWRANDWTYGRLDSAERLVKLLLNPERLHRVYHGRKADALAKLREIAWEGVESTTLQQVLKVHWDENAARIESELAFLDDPQPRFPEQLKQCSDALTARLHYGILSVELPIVRDAVLVDQSNGADKVGPGQALVASLGESGTAITPQQARRQLEAGLLGGERLLREAGSDLFTRTATHTAAALQATLASSRAHLGPLGALFAAIKLPVIALYFLSGALVRSSRTSAAIMASLLAVGVTIVVVQFGFTTAGLEKEGLSHAVVTFGWTLLALGLFFPLARAPVTALLLISSVAMAMVYISDRGLALAVAVGLIVLIRWVGGAFGKFGQSGFTSMFRWVGRFGRSLESLASILAGGLALAFAASWGSGHLRYFEAYASARVRDQLRILGLQSDSSTILTDEPILLAAVMIAVALGLALWQVSQLSRTTELRIRQGMGSVPKALRALFVKS